MIVYITHVQWLPMMVQQAQLYYNYVHTQHRQHYTIRRWFLNINGASPTQVHISFQSYDNV